METNNEYRDDHRYHKHGASSSYKQQGTYRSLSWFLPAYSWLSEIRVFFPEFIDHVIFQLANASVTIGLIMTLGSSEKQAELL